MEKVFIIEDDFTIRNELCTFLNRYGYNCCFSTNFQNIIEETISEKPDIVLLDINLPHFDGYYICREIRKVSQVPIIVVTSRDDELDELMSINLGADDFITKPYNLQILLARITAVLKRTYGNGKGDFLTCRGIVYNMAASEVEFNNNKAELTKNESKILHILINNNGKIVSRDEIMKCLWQEAEFVDDNTLTVNVNRLRKKLEDIGAVDYIQTKRGQGYILI
ncbi:DNA-binding response OmpR family regulator [Clostridium tetanomorphum]|uniref:Stage 0 sporulation protein A homolog n=1 Tax=Clostridium tetanomorphum TaxID=1553 RepID=A0A923E717_CLOTT|nr:response regulator transcription factor [Clostridium tetanomorphum]KAJ51381.1 two-component response regulator [Clostridium tetanomorphum DSM 665]MBC2396412.1 response regulator transcription factor [Clostridium tetanomorphum]MBP1863358.1 DNA-binding response OmpR family regulator [Clostridium tetanomorphum]NRS83455.1 DNA-binding response OmpR family regulator [Clostridium tetanomorphum]NRZ96655.1 DNA-binding response OmpR family regulator [Clostridium tetanomorphum]